MNKAALIEKIAEDAGITKSAAAKAIDSLIEGITRSLGQGERTTLVGLGTFQVSERKARMGRNPHTGAAIHIPAKKVVRFRASKDLEEAVNR
ncbi:MAG: HU family DNA-binding protein [Acidobacteriota bacterium]|nr:MAG: HU family DNA-binding protein [Acidobacteriota bacterium]